MSIRKPKEPEFMRELHKIREEIYEETKNLSSKENVEKAHKEVDKFLRSKLFASFGN